MVQLAVELTLAILFEPIEEELLLEEGVVEFVESDSITFALTDGLCLKQLSLLKQNLNKLIH